MHVVLLFVACALGVWSRWLVRRHGAPPMVRVIGLVAVVAATIGAIVTRHRVREALANARSVDPIERSHVLNVELARAMNITLGTMTLLIVIAAALFYFTYRYARGR